MQSQSNEQLLTAVASVLRILNDPENGIREGKLCLSTKYVTEKGEESHENA